MPELLVLFGPARLARGAQLACLGQENLGDFSQRGVFSKTYSIVAIHIDLNNICAALQESAHVLEQQEHTDRSTAIQVSSQ